MPKIGGHVSAAGELGLSLQRAQDIGAECMQIFVAPPQRWIQNRHSEAEIKEFRALVQSSGIGPNFVHGTYLVSLGTENPEHLQKSIEWLVYALNIASEMGVEGVIFHTGSHKGAGYETVFEQVCHSLSAIFDQVKEKKVKLLLENAAGAGGVIGGNFRELGRILKKVNDPRLKICLDTQHAFASGYDVKTLVGLKDVLEEFDQEIGLENLAAIHANDSKTEYKSNRDRHANIGEGFIGREGFENMLNHPSLANVPFLLEVPGIAGTGPDKENVEILKSLRKA